LDAILSEDLTDVEVNSVSGKKKESKEAPKKRKEASEKRQAKPKRNIDENVQKEIATQAAKNSEKENPETGEKTKRTFREIAAELKEKIKNLKC